MYAISFDLDTNVLKKVYPSSYTNAYSDIKGVLIDSGFAWQQGSVYFGDESVDAVQCVLVVQQLAVKYAWFSKAVKDIRMLRIEDNNDLRPAIDGALEREKTLEKEKNPESVEK